MFRVESIALPAESPVGQVTIGSATCRLSDFDLIVIQGPNGAGKTSIVSPLCGWSSETKLKWCGDPAAEASESDAKAGLLPWLLHRSSVSLMSEFMSPESALANVSGIGRLREEVELLRKLVPEASRAASTNALENLAGTAPPGRSPAIAEAILRYESSERSAWRPGNSLPREAPLTLDQYNEWGREAAAEMGGTWVDHDQVDEARMRTAEDGIRPQVSVIRGASHVKAASQQLAASIKASALGDRVERMAAAECELGLATSALAKELVVEREEVASLDFSERSKALCKELESKAAHLEEQAKAIDALAQLRSDAAKILVGLECQSCPVCDAAVEREQLIERLSKASIDATGDSLRAEAERFKGRKRRLEDLTRTWMQCDNRHREATQSAKEWLGSRVKECREYASRLSAHDGWDDIALQLADTLRSHCNDIARDQNPPDAQMIRDRLEEVSAATKRLEQACEAAEKSLDSEYRQRSARVSRAETIHKHLSLLRPILVSRAALNAEPWHDNRKERERVHGRRARIQEWASAIRSLISDREARISESGAAVLADHGVRQRFAALLRTTGHPLARSATLEAGKVMTEQGIAITRTGRSTREASKLSEGLTALVNIAAFLAIAGHSSPHQPHKAGWVLLDEPTNGLDRENRKRLAEYLGGMTMELIPKQIFITTFEDEFADMLMDAALRLSDRRVLRVRLHEWRGAPIAAPDLIPIRMTSAR